MIGSSDVSTIRKTHSHYFGIQPYDKILENLVDSNIIFKKKKTLNTDTINLLNILVKKGFWLNKTISIDTLKNHYYKGVIDFNKSLEMLIDKGFVVHSPFHKSVVSLNIKRKNDIEKVLK